jgi:hypothetical protein
MAIYFSVDSGGFYNSDAGVPIPNDAIEITEEQYNYFILTMNEENKMLVLEDGQLVLKPRQHEISWDMIKQKRNRILSQSDYTQMSDWPGNKMIWATYRQALRDITTSFSDPNEVVWPKAPDA